MAVISITRVNTGFAGVENFAWLNLANGDVGQKIACAHLSDKTAHIYGTFGTGGAATLRGSNMQNPDETNASHWFPLTDSQGNVIVKNALSGEVILENPLFISPSATGDGSTALTVNIIAITR